MFGSSSQARDGAQENYELERQLAEGGLNRPSADYVQLMWSAFISLWDGSSDAERTGLTSLVVSGVETTEQERGFCRLLFTAEGNAPT